MHMSGNPVYTVSAQAHYDAAHYLVNYQGKCERLHGHRYVVEVALQSTELNEAGIAFDFVDLKRELRSVAERWDHRLLNDLPEFEGVETSAENQARLIYSALKAKLPPEMADRLARGKPRLAVPLHRGQRAGRLTALANTEPICRTEFMIFRILKRRCQLSIEPCPSI